MFPVEEIQKKYGVEMASVVLACRVHFQTADTIELQDFIDGNAIDWDKVLEICYMHRIRMFVYRIFLTVNIPGDYRQFIKEESFSLVQHNFNQALELEMVVSALEENGITVIPYKGVIFSKQFFGDLISRESGDIDLIIKPEYLKKVIPLMNELGYRFPDENVLEHLGDDYFKRFKDIVCRKFLGDICEYTIEFHWAVTENVWAVDTALNQVMYQTHGKEKVSHQGLNLLNPNAHFISILIHHGIEELFYSLRELVDLAQIAYQKNQKLDWDHIEQAYVKAKLSKMLYLSNSLIEYVFGIQYNLGLKHFKEEEIQPFIQTILSEKRINPHEAFDIKLQMRRLGFRDTFLYKLKCLGAIAKERLGPSKKDIHEKALPNYLFFLYGISKVSKTIKQIIKRKNHF